MQNGDTLISRYDAEGLRYELEENERLVKFIFHKANVLVETDANNELISHFARGYEIVGAEIRNEDTYHTYYYIPDEQGSTLFITDSQGQVVNHYFYDAFGNVLNSAELVHNRIIYVGQQFDSIIQQYYLRARYYNSIIGRFTQEDIYRGDGLNLYAYCENNPVIYYDPSGYVPAKSSNPAIMAILQRTTINNEIPTVKTGFVTWFDGLTNQDVETLYQDTKIRNLLGNKSRLRNGGGKHEWLAVSEGPNWKKWRISVQEVLDGTSSIDSLKFINIKTDAGQILSDFHGTNPASKAAHNQIFDMIHNSKNFEQFKIKLHSR